MLSNYKMQVNKLNQFQLYKIQKYSGFSTISGAEELTMVLGFGKSI